MSDTEGNADRETETVNPVLLDSSIEETKTFQELGLCSQLCDVCRLRGWKNPTKIQCETIPVALTDRDIIGVAETGSGKTGAFVLPMLHNLLKAPQPFYGLIIAPTRELAFQIAEEVDALGSTIAVKCVCISGGIDMMTQAIALGRKPHIIVCTPGRLVDHLENTKGFSIRNLKYLVMDEADKLLQLDFEDALNKILEAAPRDRRTFLFSATMTSKVQKLQRASLKNPVKLEVSTKYQTVDTLKQFYLFIPSKFKDCYLTYLINEFAGNSVIIFVQTCNAALKISLLLRNLGFSAVPLHGQMPQPKRLGALNKFKGGTHSILIATDVASRGLDIPFVDLVINYDIPADPKIYIHRVGRTARAGRAGQAIALVSQYDVEPFQRIEHSMTSKLPLFPAEESTVLVLLQRVSEAQRIASQELREMDSETKKGRKRKDKEEGDAHGGNKRHKSVKKGKRHK